MSQATPDRRARLPWAVAALAALIVGIVLAAVIGLPFVVAVLPPALIMAIGWQKVRAR